MPEWLARQLPDGWTNGQLALAGVVMAVVSAVASLLLVGWVILRIPPDYFMHDHPPRLWNHLRPAVRLPLVVLKNLFGVGLMVVGVLLSLPGVPGQGLLTIFIGLMLVDFPGRRHVERWFLRRRGVLKTVNRIRSARGKTPLLLPDQFGVDPPQ